MTQPDFSARNQVDVLLRERADALTKRWLLMNGMAGVLAIVLTVVGNPMPEKVPGLVVMLCWIAGGVLSVLSVVLPKRELDDRAVTRWLRLPVDPYRWALQMKLTPQQKDAFMALPPSEQSVFALTIPFVRPYMMGLALALGVAAIGFVYGLLSRQVLEAAPFLIAAVALNCFHYPRLGNLIHRGRKLQSALSEEDEARALADLHDAHDKPERRGPRLRASQNTPPKPQRKSRAGEQP
jgi:hypothetical protein